MAKDGREVGAARTWIVVGLVFAAGALVAVPFRSPKLSAASAAKLDPGDLLERLDLEPEPLVLISSSHGRRAGQPYVEFALWPNGRCLSRIYTPYGQPVFLELVLSAGETERLAAVIYERASQLDGGWWKQTSCPIPLRVAARRGRDVVAFEVESYLCNPEALTWEREDNPAWPDGDIQLSASDLAVVRGYLEVDALIEERFHAPDAVPSRITLTLGPIPQPWWQPIVDRFR